MDGAKRAARALAVGGLAVTATWGLAACADDSPSGPGGSNVPVALSVTVPPSVDGPASIGPAFEITVRDGPNTLVMDRVELVIRDLNLKPDTTGSCGGGGCIQYLGEADVLPLPQDGGTLSLATRGVGVARYDRVDVSLHAPSAGEPVVDDNPEFEGASVLVEGTFNDEAFTFTSDVTTDARLALDPALVLDGSTIGANVTILVGVTSWFQSEGGGLVDPRTANQGGQNETLVETNIVDSFRAFRDDDRDGSPGTSGA